MIKELCALFIFFALVALFVWWGNYDKNVYDELMLRLDAIESSYNRNDSKGALDSANGISEYFNSHETFLRTFAVHKFADDFHIKVNSIRQAIIFKEDFHVSLEINNLRVILEEWYLESRVNLQNIF